MANGVRKMTHGERKGRDARQSWSVTEGKGKKKESKKEGITWELFWRDANEPMKHKLEGK